MTRFTLARLLGALVLGLSLTAPALADGGPTPDPWPAIRADYRGGDFDSAIARLKALLAANPDDREALYYTAIIEWRLGHLSAATAAYRRVAALDPKGPFGQDAAMWLASYATEASSPSSAPAIAPSPSPTPIVAVIPGTPRPWKPSKPKPTPKPKPKTKPAAKPKPSPARHSVLPLDALKPSGRAAWLRAQPKSRGSRARSANPRPGYFKAADGTFEFVPPKGFVLLDEQFATNELSTLFGPPKRAVAAEAPPTLLITWREFDETKRLKPDQRAAKERQLLAMEASMYGPGASLEARFGGPCYHVRQSRGGWAADTLLLFQHGRLYALTYGGAASALPRYRTSVEASWRTPIFYP